MANVIYNGYKAKIGAISWDGATDFKLILLKDTYTPDIDNHKVVNDLDTANNETSGDGYTAGGVALSNRAIVEDDTNNLALFKADDVTFTNASITTRGAVIYYDTGDTATSNLVCYLDFGGNQTVNNADFTIDFSNDCVFSIG